MSVFFSQFREGVLAINYIERRLSFGRKSYIHLVKLLKHAVLQLGKINLQVRMLTMLLLTCDLLRCMWQFQFILIDILNMSPSLAEIQAVRADQRALPDLLKYVGKMVDIKLKDKRHVQGMLSGYDNRMNVVIENWKEVVRGPQSEKVEDNVKQEEIAVLRGSSIEDVQLVEANA